MGQGRMAAVRFLSQAAAGAAAVSHPGTTAAHRSSCLYAADAIRAGGYQGEPERSPWEPPPRSYLGSRRAEPGFARRAVS